MKKEKEIPLSEYLHVEVNLVTPMITKPLGLPLNVEIIGSAPLDIF